MPIDSKLTIDDREVRDALDRVLKSLPLGGDATPAFRSIGRIVKSGTQLRFRKQQTPDGVPWKKSKRVELEGGQTLRLTGKLQRSYTYSADHASVEVGSNDVRAAIHHFGGKTGRGHKVTLPARPALGASEADTDEIVATMNDFLGKRWSGR